MTSNPIITLIESEELRKAVDSAPAIRKRPERSAPEGDPGSPVLLVGHLQSMMRNASRESAHAPARSADPDRSRTSCARHRRSAAPTTPALLPPAAASAPSAGAAAGTGPPFSTSAMARGGCRVLCSVPAAPGRKWNWLGGGWFGWLSLDEARGSRRPPPQRVGHRGEASACALFSGGRGSSAAPSTWRVPGHAVVRRPARRIKILRGGPTSVAQFSDCF